MNGTALASIDASQSLSPIAPAPPASAVPPLPHDGPVDVTRAKIAIVDDESTNIKVVSRLLNLEGFTRFATTTDARDAVEMVRRETPDLVLLDLMMPFTSGLDVLRKLRSCSETLHVPVVILTASTDHAKRIEALQSGANDFLNKPIDPSELTPRIRNLILLKLHQDRIAQHAEELERSVRQRTAQLEASRRDLIHCLARRNGIPR